MELYNVMDKLRSAAEEFGAEITGSGMHTDGTQADFWAKFGENEYIVKIVPYHRGVASEIA